MRARLVAQLFYKTQYKVNVVVVVVVVVVTSNCKRRSGILVVSLRLQITEIVKSNLKHLRPSFGSPLSLQDQ